MKLRRFLVAILFVVVAGGAHAQSDGSATPNETVIITVNGQKIYVTDILMLHESLPAEYQQLPMEVLYPQLLNSLIDRKLIAERTRDLGLDKDEPVRRQIAFQTESILEQVYLTYLVDLELSDERLRAAYEDLIAAWQPEEEVRARHILLESEADALAVIAELDEGADFEELARTRSIGPSSEVGGDLGYFRRQGDMIPVFAEAAFAMEPGEMTSAPVESSFGWHVIGVEYRRMSPPPAFDEVGEQLRNQEAEKVIGELSESLRSDATIESLKE